MDYEQKQQEIAILLAHSSIIEKSFGKIYKHMDKICTELYDTVESDPETDASIRSILQLTCDWIITEVMQDCIVKDVCKTSLDM